VSDGLFKLTVSILATWRIASLLYFDNGPFNLFASLREVIYVKSLPDLAGVVDGEEKFDRHYIFEFIHEQLTCFWCVSLWVGLFIALISTLPFDLWYGLLPFALSGASILLSGGGRTIWRHSNES
jgi:hypothetical protein